MIFNGHDSLYYLIPDGLGILSFGPHIRIEQSSETDTKMCGWTGFQATQFTVRVCPCSVAIGSSFLICQI